MRKGRGLRGAQAVIWVAFTLGVCGLLALLNHLLGGPVSW